jgi:deoxyribodipyrimidine photo-lyase
MRSLVWFRGNDLRLRDHLPLYAALRQGEAIFVYLLEPEQWSPVALGGATHRRRYLRQIVESLQRDIEERGSRLLLVAGRPLDVLPWLAAGCHVDEVLTQRQTDPLARQTSSKLEAKLSVPLRLLDGETLVVPGSMRTTTGGPYSVFTAFAKAIWRQLDVKRPIPAPARLPPLPVDVAKWVATAMQQPKEDWKLLNQLPELDEQTPDGQAAVLQGGERDALKRLKHFVTEKGQNYVEARDRLALDGTSRLSGDLKFGSVSPRQIWTAATKAMVNDAGRTKFLTQLLWREFAYSTLWDRPDLLTQPFQARFARFPWRKDPQGYAAWAEGRTGYPVVDAAARQLLREGYVHNRARMIAASFLAKDLLIDFRLGESHYLEWLIDGDRAQNDLGWQWSSGCGCDAQPYFRVFNPVTQGERFDPEGHYVRRYLPELARLSTRYIHAPWLAPPEELARAGIRLDQDYPAPIVEHAGARNRFLAIAAEHFGKGEGSG